MSTYALWALVGGAVLAGCGDGDKSLYTSSAGPRIAAMSPAPTQGYMTDEQDFVVEFTEPMSRETVEAAYQVLDGRKPIEGEFTWNEAGTLMRFRPLEPLAPGAELRIRMGGGMRSARGHPMLDWEDEPLAAFEFSERVYAVPAPFESNGERIYFTATSASGEPITFAMAAGFEKYVMRAYGAFDFGGMGGMMGRGGMMGDSLESATHYGMSCASCHGPEGRGGRYLAMGAVQVPDIRHAVLTGGETDREDGEGDGEHRHTPYDEQSIRRAIVRGLDPDGEELEALMPRWNMAERDLDDLVEFLQAL